MEETQVSKEENFSKAKKKVKRKKKVGKAEQNTFMAENLTHIWNQKGVWGRMQKDWRGDETDRELNHLP